MCIIIHKPKGISLSEEITRKASRINPDGFGVMYYDPEADRIVANKWIDYDIESVVKFVESLKDYEAVFHYRIKTHGTISLDNCHPFKVLAKDDNEGEQNALFQGALPNRSTDMYFMHNGVISVSKPQGDDSDTVAFNKEYLQPVLKHKPLLIRSKAFRSMIGHTIGKGSKLVFMFGKGTVLKVNEEQGVEKDGCWFSNSNSFPYVAPITSVYPTTYNAHRGNNYAGSNQKTTQTSQTSTGSREKECKLIGDPVKVGTKVVVFSKDDADFVAEGTVKWISHSTLTVSFTNSAGVMQDIDVYQEDGTSMYMKGRHYAMVLNPENDVDPKDLFENKTVEQQEAFINDMEEKFAKELEEDEKKAPPLTTTGSTVVNLSSFKQAALFEDDGGLVLDDASDDKKKGQSTEEPYEPEPEILEYNGLKLDTSLCKGAADLENADDEYGYDADAKTFFDVYSMLPLQRLEFFIDKPELSFAMFQDLLDFFVLFGESLTEGDEEHHLHQIS